MSSVINHKKRSCRSYHKNTIPTYMFARNAAIRADALSYQKAVSNLMTKIKDKESTEE